MKDTCTLYVIDEFGEEKTLEYKSYEYRSLMDLVLNELWEDWGDCRGKAMCGTCHIEILSGKAGDEIEPFEEQTLEGLPNRTSGSRLACQISIDQSIDKMKFRILKDF